MKETEGLRVDIVSPEKTLFSGEVECLVIPGEKGTFEVLHNHAPIISNLVAGKVVCKGNAAFEVAIKSGFVEVAQNVVSVCVEENI